VVFFRHFDGIFKNQGPKERGRGYW
jgi:hypothetical protein